MDLLQRLMTDKIAFAQCHCSPSILRKSLGLLCVKWRQKGYTIANFVLSECQLWLESLAAQFYAEAISKLVKWYECLEFISKKKITWMFIVICLSENDRNWQISSSCSFYVGNLSLRCCFWFKLLAPFTELMTLQLLYCGMIILETFLGACHTYVQVPYYLFGLDPKPPGWRTTIPDVIYPYLTSG